MSHNNLWHKSHSTNKLMVYFHYKSQISLIVATIFHAFFNVILPLEKYSEALATFTPLPPHPVSYITFYTDIAQFRLMAMFTAFTGVDIKEKVVKSFSQLKGKLQIIVETFDFRMGMDCSNARRVIHCGPPSGISNKIHHLFIQHASEKQVNVSSVLIQTACTTKYYCFISVCAVVTKIFYQGSKRFFNICDILSLCR